jgi:proline iminopeptidase
MTPRPGRSSARDSILDVGIGRLYVREIGQGPPMIVLHGGPDFDHEYLLPDLDRLAALCRLVYYDQRGRGRSFTGEDPDVVTLGSEMEDVDAVRGWTGASSVALLGHSWGALLALEYAIRYPERVSRLVLMNAAPASHADMLVFRAALASGRSAEQRERMADLASDPAYLAGDIAADAEYYRIHFGSAFHRREHLDLVIGRLRRGFTSDGIVAARAIEERLYEQTWASEAYDLLPSLRRLHVPTLVLHGQEDLVPPDAARQIAAAIPGSRLVMVPACGHFAYLEQPDRVRAEIAAFLAAQDEDVRTSASISR